MDSVKTRERYKPKKPLLTGLVFELQLIHRGMRLIAIKRGTLR